MDAYKIKILKNRSPELLSNDTFNKLNDLHIRKNMVSVIVKQLFIVLCLTKYNITYINKVIIKF